jgi:hypothetical protein
MHCRLQQTSEDPRKNLSSFNSNKVAKNIHNYNSFIEILTNHIGEWYKNISFPVVKMRNSKIEPYYKY